MKKFYTSNYARKCSDPNAVGISKSIKEWYGHVANVAPELAPTWELIDGHKYNGMSDKGYEVGYLQLLLDRGLTPEGVIDKFKDGTIFLCYETPTDFCHRHVLANWLNESSLVHIEEWKNEKEVIEQDQADFVDSVLDFE